ncbi:MAG: hypothetical protein ACE5H0_13240 [Bacteroidota bacterium]
MRHSQRVPSVAIRRCLDLLGAEGREKLSATELLSLFREHGFVVGESCQSMVERMLNRGDTSLDCDSLIAAADDLVACCDGSTDDAFDVLEAYTRAAGNQAGPATCGHRTERAQGARVVPR